jgi:hypothetical protein
MKRIFKGVVDALFAMQEERARMRLIDELDERTLRDIGMEREANQARERTRLALRFASY